MKTQLVSLKDILEDSRFQFRESSLGKNVAELKRLMQDKIEVEPVILWKQKHGYLILDGDQRVRAARAVRGVDGVIKAKVVSFPEDDYKSAFLYAISANQKHGAQLEKPDRAKMAWAMLKEFPKFSNVQIAKRCGLAESTVRGYRSKMPEAQSSTRLGADGREISLPKESSKSKKHTDEQSNEESAETDNIDSVEQMPEAQSSTRLGANGREISLPKESSKSKKHTDEQSNNESAETAVQALLLLWFCIQSGRRDSASRNQYYQYTPSDLTDEDALHEHPDLLKLGIDPSELTGDLTDFMDDLHMMRNYFEGLLKRSDLSDDDIEQAQAMHAAIAGLHKWRSSMFVPEDS